jgi:hypothetical protein
VKAAKVEIGLCVTQRNCVPKQTAFALLNSNSASAQAPLPLHTSISLRVCSKTALQVATRRREAAARPAALARLHPRFPCIRSHLGDDAPGSRQHPQLPRSSTHHRHTTPRRHRRTQHIAISRPHLAPQDHLPITIVKPEEAVARRKETQNHGFRI